ncbi:L-serine ammonia-lyase, iron-sulfur-dependent, subunit alpha [Sedimenticola sp.]|uniref:L-serine ammonia-lyase, iron-sulfur-dependent, subunit alpha n=1 Tax=Sedimenticola sp. TaxID=1940285 RepID=UPI003D1281FD
MPYPSLFNDVIGPVMRGPSSSHCAASLRIGRLCRDLMGGTPDEVLIQFDPNGSLAATYEAQGADMGLMGGLLGWDAQDARLPGYRQAIAQAGVRRRVEIVDIAAEHPNTYRISLSRQGRSRQVIALSVGGGMIEIIAIDGAPLSIAGDYYETLIETDTPESVCRFIEQSVAADACLVCRGGTTLVEVKSPSALTAESLSALARLEGVSAIMPLNPILPVMSRKDLRVPFMTAAQLLDYNRERSLALWELALDYEAARGNITREQAWQKMATLVGIMQAAVQTGLQGTDYADRILGCQSGRFREQMQRGRLVEGDLLNRIILYVTAIMEVKSAMGVIVAAPTAGSCGALPGAVLATAEALGATQEETVRALLAAGLIGVFLAAHATFAAEVGGCQAECGSGAGMAAAAIVQLAGGSLGQSLAAASLALQNSFGMVCDSIANRVEAPCLGKNIMAATNALSCANMALADYDPLIPLDEVIVAMHQVGQSIPNDLRCTGLGGLAMTPAAKAIEQRLADQGMVGLSTTGKRFKVC